MAVEAKVLESLSRRPQTSQELAKGVLKGTRFARGCFRGRFLEVLVRQGMIYSVAPPPESGGPLRYHVRSEHDYRLASGKVLDALRKRPLTRSQVLSGPLRGTAYSQPIARDELLTRLVYEGLVHEVATPGTTANYRNAIYHLATPETTTHG